jgi:hypothetical protein
MSVRRLGVESDKLKQVSTELFVVDQHCDGAEGKIKIEEEAIGLSNSSLGQLL